MTKYIILIADGMSDLPLKQLSGRTPLQAARTPNLDFLAKNGTMGWAKNIPHGLKPGSDVAAVSIFGYNPKKYYTGRGPLEAASLGVKLKKGDIAFRCNLVTVKNGRMFDFTAGHIDTPAARKIMRVLDKKLGRPGIKFYPGLSYRHLLVISDKLVSPNIKGTPPHDITGQSVEKYLPHGKGAQLLLELMRESEQVLKAMQTKATVIWPWGQGATPQMPSFKQKFGKTGAIITAVHLLKGLGKIVGLEVIDVPGATGYLDTNYVGKAEYALRTLKKRDVVFVHVESPDEAGHEGNLKHKLQAIEDFDAKVVGTIVKKLGIRQLAFEKMDRKQKAESREPKAAYKILVLPDHPTPIRLKTHTADPVPFVIFDTEKLKQTGVKGFSEKEARKFNFTLKGHELLNFFFSR